MDGLHIENIFEIELPNNKNKFNIFPVGDIHLDSVGFDREVWKRDLKRIKAIKEPCYFLGMGDYTDFTRWTTRSTLRKTVEDEIVQEKMDLSADRLKKELVKDLEFTKGRWIGVHAGNHDWSYSDGALLSNKLATELGGSFLGETATTVLKIKTFRGGHRSNVNCLKIFSAHGTGGGGTTIGNSLNQVDKMRNIYGFCDLYLMGHNHHKDSKQVELLDFSTVTGRIYSHPQWLIRTGSYTRGYVPNKGTYVSKKLMRPVSLGCVRIEVEMVRDQKNGKDFVRPQIHVWK